MIYFDNAATTKPYESIMEIVKNYTSKEFYNPSSVYLPAFEIKKTLKENKQTLAKLLNVEEKELTFTSGATESNNLFLQGVITSNKQDEFIFNLGEHASIYEVANFIKSKGYTVHFVPLLENGKVDVNELMKLVNENTRLVSVMHVSNETGAINDIKTIVKLVKQKNAKTLVHSDGVQAFGKLAVNIKELGVDAYTISAHKIHGLKGAGAIFIKNGVFVKPLILGGGQEDGRRSGTENIIGALSLVNAASTILKNREANANKVAELKEAFINKIKNLPYVSIHSTFEGSPYIISFSVLNIKSEILVHMLAKNGLLLSTGSSCSSNSKHSGNKTLEAMGKSKAEVLGSLRVSFSEFNTLEEVEVATNIFIKTTQELLHKIA